MSDAKKHCWRPLTEIAQGTKLTNQSTVDYIDEDELQAHPEMGDESDGWRRSASLKEISCTI
jgi:hypothetical protein